MLVRSCATPFSGSCSFEAAEHFRRERRKRAIGQLWKSADPDPAGPGCFHADLHFVALVENGTHVLFGAKLGRYADSETTLAHDVVPALQPGMLCLADDTSSDTRCGSPGLPPAPTCCGG